MILAAFICRYAQVFYGAKMTPEAIKNEVEVYRERLSSGIHRAGEQMQGFTDAFFAHPTEITPFMEKAGFETQALIGCEGIIFMVEEKIQSLPDDLFQTWADLNYQLGKDPCLHSSAIHLLYVGKKLM